MEGVEKFIPKDAETALVFFVNGKKVNIFLLYVM